MSLEQIESFLDGLSDLGPLPGILAPFAEAFLPFLPLILIVVANVNIYGFGFGLVFSWLGTSLGSATIFTICRKFSDRVRDFIIRKFPMSSKMFAWIEKRGFTPLFLLMCFPFTPSIVITLVAGLSKLSFQTFIIAMLIGKAIMVTCVSVLGYDFVSLLQNPTRLILTVLAVFVLWYGGKRLEKRFNSPENEQ